MNQKILSFTYPALKQSVASRVENALIDWLRADKMPVKVDTGITLFKSKNFNSVLYISGVALQWSKFQNLPTVEVATAIASCLLETCSEDFSAEVIPPGWIHLQLTEAKLAAWLQSLATGGIGEEEGGIWDVGTGRVCPDIGPEEAQIQNSWFEVQYAHARCCSLLRMAHREGLITLKEPDPHTSPPFWSVSAPDPIPWLNSDQKLHLTHPVEKRLIAELVQVLDEVCCASSVRSVNLEKAALNLSEAFLSFWSCCRIWGEVKISSLQLAQARLGLIMVTQSVLRFLLQQKFNLLAPLEL